MSGICAVWQRDDPNRVARTLAAVNAGLSLVPEERASQVVAQGAGVAVQARFGSQQIFRNSQVLLACDAELSNEGELRKDIGGEVQGLGVAALLTALYERHGDRFVERLRGGFSVVLWDDVERHVLAAIDGFGIKRLAWYGDGKVLLIASRVDALRGGTDHLTINPRAIANVLNFSTNLAPETIFTNVQRLAPGMLMKSSEGQTRAVRYWDMRYGIMGNSSEARLCADLEDVVAQSVKAHSPSHASGIGAFLSGGTDSSTVVGLMTRAAGGPVKAFSIGFQEQVFNELGYAELAARSFGCEHYTYLVSAQDCMDSLTDVVRCFDEPFCNASTIPTYFCARLAAQNGVGTLLAGDGGDELFGGNERYATDKIFETYHAIPKPLRVGLIEPLAALPINLGLMRKARGYIRRANMRGVERMLSFQFLRTHAAADVFDGDFLQSLGDYSVLDIPSCHYALAPARDHLDRLLYVDMKITLADNDLPKVSCMSELAGVRTRFPFLDRSVAEFSGRIPARLKVRGFQKRYLFKRAFRNLLPPEILRKKKHGFGIPVALWMKSNTPIRDLTHDTLKSNRAFGRGYFRRAFIEDLFRRHQASDDTFYGDTLWAFLLVELWHRHFIDEPARVVA